MTFINPLALIGLMAATIPIVLHLLNIRKLRTIEFSTISFLKKLQKNKMRRIKIRQWLLLILRTLLIVLIVLSFSRPALKGSFGGMGSHAKTTIVIILDNTPSMSLQNERGNFLKQAQSTAMQIVDLLQEGDEAFFLRLSDLPEPTIGEPTHNPYRLREAITQTGISTVHRTIEEAVRLSSRLLQQSRNFNKEIYILTDGQRTSFSLAERKKEQQSREHMLDASTQVFVVTFANKDFDNIGIVQTRLAPSLFQKGRPFVLRATVKNYGKMPAQNVLASLYLDGTRVMQKSISLNAGATSAIDFSAIPTKSGTLSGMVELEDDLLESDNRSYSTIAVPEQLQGLLVSSNPGNSYFLRTALTLFSQTGPSTPVRLREIPPSLLATSTVQDADIVMLADGASLTESQVNVLKDFVKIKGGGLLFFPGNAMSIDSYNALLAPAFDLPTLKQIQIQTGANQSSPEFEKIDFEHPIFQGMFETDAKSKENARVVESPRITRTLLYSELRKIQPLITLNNSVPFIWEQQTGNGRIIGCSVTATTEWSDFPLKGLFVPWLYQSVLYLSQGSRGISGEPSTYAGDHPIISLTRVHARLTQRTPSAAIQVRNPEGRSTLVQPYTIAAEGGSSSSVVSLTDCDLPGVYTILQGPDTLTRLALNPNPLESDGAMSNHGQLRSTLMAFGSPDNSIIIQEATDSISELILQSRFGIELWKQFLYLAIVIALIEMAVAREKKNEIP